MKRSILILTAIVAMAAFAAPSFAQSAGPKGQAGQGQTRRGPMNGDFRKKLNEIQAKVIKELKLNADQTKKVNAAIKKRDAAAKKLQDQIIADQKAGKKLDRTALQKKFQAVQTTFDKEMKAGMGEAKYKTFQKRMREEMEKLRKQRQQNRPTGKAGNRTGGK